MLEIDPKLTGCGPLDYGRWWCVRPAGHEGEHRPVKADDLIEAEKLVGFHLGGDEWAWAKIDDWYGGRVVLGATRLGKGRL